MDTLYKGYNAIIIIIIIINILLEKPIAHNLQDINLKNTTTDTTYLIDISVPDTQNLPKKRVSKSVTSTKILQSKQKKNMDQRAVHFF
jgi:hypothetical protein